MYKLEFMLLAGKPAWRSVRHLNAPLPRCVTARIALHCRLANWMSNFCSMRTARWRTAWAPLWTTRSPGRPWQGQRTKVLHCSERALGSSCALNLLRRNSTPIICSCSYHTLSSVLLFCLPLFLLPLSPLSLPPLSPSLSCPLLPPSHSQH